MHHFSTLLFALPLAVSAARLPTFPRATNSSSANTNCAPGGELDLSKWELQMPIAGSSGGVKTVSSSSLQGCSGYSNSQYFYTDPTDGSVVMKAPSSDACPAKTSGSEHCRTEFHETNPSSWDPSTSTNRMFAQLKGVTGSSTVIGQVFQASGNSKPLAELYYSSSGEINFRAAYSAQGGGGQSTNVVGNVPPGTKFTYEIRFEQNQLCIAVNGGSCQSIKTYFTTPSVYFKAGDYNQAADDSAQINFYQLTTTH